MSFRLDGAAMGARFLQKLEQKPVFLGRFLFLEGWMNLNAFGGKKVHYAGKDD